MIYFSGRAGNIVGRKGKNGEYVVAVHQPHVNQPNTQAQLEARAKLKTFTQGLKAFSSWAKKMCKESGLTGWQALIKWNCNEAVSGTYPNYEIDYSKCTLANGSLELPFNAQASVDSNTLSVTWADNSGMGTALATDKVCIVILDKNKNLSISDYSVADRSQRTGSVTIPTAWNSDGIEVWMAMISEKGDISKSAYLGEFTV